MRYQTLPSIFIAIITPSIATAIPRTQDPISQLQTIMPTSSTCSPSSQLPSECSTSTLALPHLLSSFSTYNITTAPGQAALLSWIAYETAELKYNANHFPPPGVPGQGTRNMMSAAFVREYALSIPQVAGMVSSVSSPEEVLALVQTDEYSFGSAAWFYASQCSESVKEGVQFSGEAGWEAWITGCVGTSVDEGTGETSRKAYWERASMVLGVV